MSKTVTCTVRMSSAAMNLPLKMVMWLVGVVKRRCKVPFSCSDKTVYAAHWRR